MAEEVVGLNEGRELIKQLSETIVRQRDEINMLEHIIEKQKRLPMYMAGILCLLFLTILIGIK